MSDERYGFCHATCCSGETNIDAEIIGEVNRIKHFAEMYAESYCGEDISELLVTFALDVLHINGISFCDGCQYHVVDDPSDEHSANNGWCFFSGEDVAKRCGAYSKRTDY